VPRDVISRRCACEPPSAAVCGHGRTATGDDIVARDISLEPGVQLCFASRWRRLHAGERKEDEMAKGLTEKQEKLLALFKIAIEREREAQRAYSEMLDFTEDPTLRNVLESFVKQERKHEETLMEKYAELRRTEEFKDAP
jgi:hypothetical protein